MSDGKKLYGGADESDKQGAPTGGMRGEGSFDAETASGYAHAVELERGKQVMVEEMSGVTFAEATRDIGHPTAPEANTPLEEPQAPAPETDTPSEQSGEPAAAAAPVIAPVAAPARYATPTRKPEADGVASALIAGALAIAVAVLTGWQRKRRAAAKLAASRQPRADGILLVHRDEPAESATPAAPAIIVRPGEPATPSAAAIIVS